MKKQLQRMFSAGLCLVLMLTLIPAEAVAAEMVTPISSVEEFMEIMDRPNGSYRLEEDLDLGLIEPLGNKGAETPVAFTGSLDGNGHTVRYQMGYAEGCAYYGLFAWLSGAEITNMTVDADLNIMPPQDAPVRIYVAAVCGTGDKSPALSGLNVRADIRYEDDSAERSVYISGVGGYGCVLNTVDVELSVEAKSGNTLYFFGNSLYGRGYNCTVSGEVSLAARDVNAYVLYGAEDSAADVEVEVESTEYADIYGASNCKNVYVCGNYAPDAAKNEGSVSVCGLHYCTDSVFEGSLIVENQDAAAIGLNYCTDSSFEGSIETDGGYAYGIEYSEGCTFRGDIAAKDGGAGGMLYSNGCEFYGSVRGDDADLWGMQYSDNSVFEGSLVNDSGEDECLVIAISDGIGCRFRGDICNTDAKGEGMAIGVHDAENSSFEGSIYVDGNAYVADEVSKTVIRADVYGSKWIYVLDQADQSSFEGTVTAGADGRVFGMDDCQNSLCKTDLSGAVVEAVYGGSGNYFVGDLYATGTAVVFSGGTNNVAKGNVLVQAQTEGYLYGAGTESCAFEGTAVCYAGKYFEISGVDVTAHLTGYGFSAGTLNGSWEYRDHRNTCLSKDSPNPKCNCEKLGTATQLGGASIDTLPNIDLENEGLRPDEDENAEPRNYTLRLVGVNGEPVAGAIITMSGVEYETDEGGCIAVTNGPSIVSPLQVELWDEEKEEYFVALSRSAYYPVPNRVNELRLEPQLEFELTSLEKGAEEPGKGVAAGYTATVMGQPLKLLSFEIDVGLEQFFKELNMLQVAHDKESGNYVVYLGAKKDMNDGKGLSWVKSTYRNVDDPLRRKLLHFSGMEGYVGAGAFAEIGVTYDPWEMKLVDGGLAMRGSLGGRQVYPLGLGLAYGTIALQGDLTVESKLGLAEDGEGYETDQLQLQTEAEMEARIEGALGAGARFARSYVEGGISGSLLPTLSLPMESLEDGLTVDAKAAVFMDFRFLNLVSNRIKFVESDPVRLWPQENAIDMYSLSAAAEEAEYSVLSRDYAAAEPALLSEGETYMGLDESSYPYGEVSLTPLGNGRYLLVYTDDDLSRAAADRSTLRACIGWEENDGTLTWGEAVTVEDDGTADFGFDVEVSGSTAAILWQDAKESFGEGEQLTTEEAAAAISLTQVLLDCKGDIPVAGEVSTVAEAGSMPYHPTVSCQGNSIRAAWVTTANENPAVYTDEETETVWLAENGEAAVIAEGQQGISAVALTAESLLWSVGTGKETELWNYENEELCSIDEGAILELQSRGGQICYVKDGVLYKGSSGLAMNRAMRQGEDISGLLQLSADGNVYAAQLGTDESRVCSVQDGKQLPIGAYEGYLSAWDVADGHIVGVLRHGFNEDSDTVTASFVNETSEELVAIWVGEAVCGNRLAVPHSQVNIRVPVFNDGYGKLESLAVAVIAEDGTELFAEEVSCAIEACETKEITFGFTVPEGFTAQNVTISIADQSQSMLLGGSNLSLNAKWSAYDADYIRAKVSNNGIGTVSGTVRLTDENGTVLDEQAVTVAENGEETLVFALEKKYTEPAALTVTLTEPAGNDSSDNTVNVLVEPVTAKKLWAGPDLYLAKNERAQMELRCFPTGSLLPALYYTVENPNIAQVDENGVVTAFASGETTVTATTADGAAYTIAVTVDGTAYYPAISESFRDIYDSAVLTQKDDSFTLRVTGEGEKLDGMSVWVVQYNGDGRMIGVERIAASVSGNSAVFNGVMPASGKLFLLDRLLRPIISAQELPLS